MINAKNKLIPVLPLRDIVAYPGNIVPLLIGRIKSMKALEIVMNGDKKILLVTQKKADTEKPKADDLNKVGTVGNVIQAMTLPDGMLKVLVGVQERVTIKSFQMKDGILLGTYTQFPVTSISRDMNDAYLKLLREGLENFSNVKKDLPADQLKLALSSTDAVLLAFLVVQFFDWSLEEKQTFLENKDSYNQIEEVIKRLEYELEVTQIESSIRNRVREQMQKSQREYYLNEQIKAIQQELGQESGSEIAQLEEKIKKSGMSEKIQEKAMNELGKLKQMPPISSEATVVRNYLDWLIAVPWKKGKLTVPNLKKARTILDSDHYGLDKVKDRIIEFLAVQYRKQKVSGTILCLVGPPGVGKTSLAKSIAKATGRKYMRMSLGGIRDEAEIRGHRRTYIGANPGRIIQGMRKAETINPLFLLDELDKLASDWRGDPAAALLEVLDPEQNSFFTDHYLEVEYDLSNVFFMATANSYNIPLPLLDRMEIIPVSGYTENEKVKIAQRYLWPKQVKANALNKKEISISVDAVHHVIRDYTRESGVRSLERKMAQINRKALRSILEGKETPPVKVNVSNLSKYLGTPTYIAHQKIKTPQIGVVTGLAWTQVGGEILSIESVLVQGKGRFTSTGQLGDVMKESVIAAEYYIKSHLHELGIPLSVLETKDVHVHVPEGATPKDGPSAGVTMVMSMVSSLTNIPVKPDVAMTGEITLKGVVLPIGGLKEKLLAAIRMGIKDVFIPKDNEKDLEEMPPSIFKNLKIHPVSDVWEIIQFALIDTLPIIPVGKKMPTEIRLHS